MTWEELYVEYSDKVHNYILLMVADTGTAEDLTHDTYVKVKQSLHRFRGDASYYTWLISIARNVVFDFLRRKRKIRFIPLPDSYTQKDTNTPEVILQKEEKVIALYKAINRLKINYREVLILRKIQEFSVEETSTILGWSESKVKSTTSRALQALITEWEYRYQEGGENR